MTALEISLMASILRARESGFEATACALEDLFFAPRAERTDVSDGVDAPRRHRMCQGSGC